MSERNIFKPRDSINGLIRDTELQLKEPEVLARRRELITQVQEQHAIMSRTAFVSSNGAVLAVFSDYPENFGLDAGEEDEPLRPNGPGRIVVALARPGEEVRVVSTDETRTRLVQENPKHFFLGIEEISQLTGTDQVYYGKLTLSDRPTRYLYETLKTRTSPNGFMSLGGEKEDVFLDPGSIGATRQWIEAGRPQTMGAQAAAHTVNN